jgi:hypothetical protein
MNHVLVGSKTIDNGASLQVTGDMTTTGGVKLGGLTNSNAQTRVVVSDADGNLYYRDASTLAANDILRSSLAVNGPLRARSLTLSDGAGTWPDYVFDSSYRLEDLREVERYLHEHHHLPGVASAEEIAGKGLNVGENQAVLLKKIEELTLYAIGLEKKLGEEHEQNRQQTARVDAQSAEMEMLRKEMADLRKMIMNKPDKQ